MRIITGMTETVTIDLPASLMAALKAEARRRRIGVVALVQVIVEETAAARRSKKIVKRIAIYPQTKKPVT